MAPNIFASVWDALHESKVLLVAPCLHCSHVGLLSDVALVPEVVEDLVLTHKPESHGIRRGPLAGVALGEPAPIMGRTPIPFASWSGFALRNQLVLVGLLVLPFAAGLAGAGAAFSMAAAMGAFGHTE